MTMIWAGTLLTGSLFRWQINAGYLGTSSELRGSLYDDDRFRR